MKVEEEACRARGFVSPSFVGADGIRKPFDVRCNKLSYMSAEAMAAAFGGDPSYIPARVGFIYGDHDVMPSESTISRSQSWENLLEELSYSDDSAVVDVQVVGFSYSPTLGAEKPSDPGSSPSDSSDSGSDSSSDYCNILSTGSNAITFHAVSNSSDRGAAFDSAAFSSGKYIYQAVLLGQHNGKYYILSRVSLKSNGRYLQKPENFEVALDWTVVFH